MSAETELKNDHERTDADIKPLVYLGIILALMTAVSMVAMAFMFDYFESRGRRDAAEVSPLRRGIEANAAPKLEVSPNLNNQLYESREGAYLEDYQWIDKDEGIARIPISRAMEILASKGSNGVGGDEN